MAFVWDLSRNGDMVVDSVDTKTYHPLKINMNKLNDKMMLNRTANVDNMKYDTYVSGSTNMTSTLKIPAFISKGHFFQVTEVVDDSIPTIRNSNGDLIVPSSDVDETHIGVEQTTGVTTVAYESL